VKFLAVNFSLIMSDAITQCRFAIAEVWSYLDPGQAINELFKDVTFLAFKLSK
jgi:hypothetical protein